MERRMHGPRPTRLYSTTLSWDGDEKCGTMATLMCHRATGGSAPARMAAALILLALTAVAQTTPPDSIRPNWRKIGSSTMELSLASPATGPVSRVWFSSGGALDVLTASGRIFESADMVTWAPAANPVDLPSPPPSLSLRSPVPGA